MLDPGRIQGAQIAEEGMDGGQAIVAGRRTVVPVLLQVVEEATNGIVAEFVQRKLGGGRLMQAARKRQE